MDGVKPNAKIKSMKRYAKIKMLLSTVLVIILSKWYTTMGNDGKILKKVNSSQLLYTEKKKGKTNNPPVLSLYRCSISKTLLFLIILSLFK